MLPVTGWNSARRSKGDHCCSCSAISHLILYKCSRNENSAQMSLKAETLIDSKRMEPLTCLHHLLYEKHQSQLRAFWHCYSCPWNKVKSAKNMGGFFVAVFLKIKYMFKTKSGPVLSLTKSEMFSLVSTVSSNTITCKWTTLLKKKKKINRLTWKLYGESRFADIKVCVKLDSHYVECTVNAFRNEGSTDFFE